MYIFLYLLTFFVDVIEIIGILEIYCGFWRGLGGLGVEIFGRGGFSGFLEMGGILECDGSLTGGRVDVLGEIGCRVDEYCEGG